MRGAEKRVGIRDVAQAAGLSITTVSWALNGKGEVAAATRVRVRRVADELGYRPNEAARALQSGRSRILGVAVAHRETEPWQQTYLPYYRSVVAGAAIEAVNHGHAIAAIPVSGVRGLEVPVPFDGLIVVDPVHHDPVLEECRRRGIRVVADGRPIDPGFEDIPVVESDIATGLGLALDDAAGQGARHFALLTGPQPDAFTLDTERHFRDWCRRHGLRSTVRRVRATESPHAAAADLLDRHPEIDAAHALNETYGRALLEVAAERQIAVPDRLHVSMMGEPSRVDRQRGVSYLSLDPVSVGAACVRLLIATLNDEPAENILIPCAFVSGREAAMPLGPAGNGGPAAQVRPSAARP